MQDADRLAPLDVEVHVDQRQMRIKWSDGHDAVYDFEALRWACPCAQCAGEGNIPGVVTLDMVFTPEQTTLERVKWIGRYALAPIWADGHDTGLFTYQKLRGMCQCEEHAAASAGADA